MTSPVRLLARIGPEIVAAASDNDPTNVGTATAVGAGTAYQLSWVAILVGPVLGVVQAIAAHVGVVAHADLQSMTLKRYGPRVAGVLMISVVVVNVVTISADLQAGAAGIGLLAGIDPRWPVLPLGTTLTSYVYVWETIGRGVEDPPDDSPLDRRLVHARVGAVAGAVFTAVILWSMLVTAAATLGQHHQTAATAQQAAQELRPLAGSLATDLFAIGLITSAVVALPVLMATTAYVVGAQFNWRRGLSEGISRAYRFYTVLGASIGLAVAMAMAGVPVLGMLVAASLIAGFATPIGLVVLVRLARDPEVMGDHPITARLAAAGWAVAVIVGGLGVFYAVGAAAGKF